jgi:hypothetical protein
MSARELLRLCGLWVVCSVASLAFLILIQFVGDRLLMAAKLEQIGLWGIYVGLALHTIAAIMLTPASASRRYVTMPEWVDLALGLAAVAAWGMMGVVAIRWWRRRRASG